jgi:hypothetical protein
VGDDMAKKIKDCFWIINDQDGDKAIFYTTNTKKLKSNIQPFAEYNDSKKGKVIAFQYLVSVGTKEYEQLMKELKLTEKDRLKEERKRKQKKVDD